MPSASPSPLCLHPLTRTHQAYLAASSRSRTPVPPEDFLANLLSDHLPPSSSSSSSDPLANRNSSNRFSSYCRAALDQIHATGADRETLETMWKWGDLEGELRKYCEYVARAFTRGIEGSGSESSLGGVQRDEEREAEESEREEEREVEEQLGMEVEGEGEENEGSEEEGDGDAVAGSGGGDEEDGSGSEEERVPGSDEEGDLGSEEEEEEEEDEEEGEEEPQRVARAARASSFPPSERQLTFSYPAAISHLRRRRRKVSRRSLLPRQGPARPVDRHVHRRRDVRSLPLRALDPELSGVAGTTRRAGVGFKSSRRWSIRTTRRLREGLWRRLRRAFLSFGREWAS